MFPLVPVRPGGVGRDATASAYASRQVRRRAVRLVFVPFFRLSFRREALRLRGGQHVQSQVEFGPGVQRFAQREGHRVYVNLDLVAHERVRVHFVPRVSPRRLERIRALRAHQFGVPVHLGREPLQALALVLRAHERDVELLNQPVGDAHDGVARVFESARRLGGDAPMADRSSSVKSPLSNAPSSKNASTATPRADAARVTASRNAFTSMAAGVVAGVVSSAKRRHLRRSRGNSSMNSSASA